MTTQAEYDAICERQLVADRYTEKCRRAANTNQNDETARAVWFAAKNISADIETERQTAAEGL